MKTKKSLLCILIACLTLLLSSVAFAADVAKIGDVPYATLIDAINVAVDGDEIVLLADAEGGFDIGVEGNEKATAKNITIDMDGYKINLVNTVGSSSTKNNGIRILAYSGLTLTNGELVASNENNKVILANYGELTLENVIVGVCDNTIYTINNRGKLTLKGNTVVPTGRASSKIAITNDPYNGYYEDFDAELNIDSEEVEVGVVQAELYGNNVNAGGVVLNISAGKVEKVIDDGATKAELTGNITGGTFEEAVDEKFCANCFASEPNEDGTYSIAEQPYVATIGETRYTTLLEAIAAVQDGETITLVGDAEGGFDIGVEGNEKATAKNITIDMGGHKIDLVNTVGSSSTKNNGIRILAYSGLTLINGELVASNENNKAVLANYGELTLEDVVVGICDNTQYTINNRGILTLKGKTIVPTGKAGMQVAITNDPYNGYYEDFDAELNIDSEEVEVGVVQAELYGNNVNAGGVVLNISAGKIEKVIDDGATKAELTGNITGGEYANPVDEKFLNKDNLVELKDGNTDNENPYTYHKTVADAMALADEDDTITDLGASEDDTTYTLVLDFGYDNLKQEITVLADEIITLPKATRKGYNFNAWYNGEEVYEAESEYTIIDSVTLTAKWTKKASSGGGSNAPTKYRITVGQTTGGTISPETLKVEKGDDQTFTIKANEGYKLVDVLVDGESIGSVTEYTFENVKKTHSITAKFEKVEEVVEETWKNPFTDVAEKDWFYSAVKFANENKLFNGVSDTKFGPNVNMTRGMLVTALYRLESEPATNKSIPFTDVDMSMYYGKAISWAKQNNIVNGVDEVNFAPNAQITREQFVTILYRYAKAKGMDVSVGEDTNILSYDDVNQVSEYAIPALQWACGAGIINGRTATTLAPKGTATRAEVATMLMRFCK